MDITRSYKVNVEPSSGCVFCDLDLATKQVALGGSHFHEISATGRDGNKTVKFIRCPLKS